MRRLSGPPCKNCSHILPGLGGSIELWYKTMMPTILHLSCLGNQYQMNNATKFCCQPWVDEAAPLGPVAAASVCWAWVYNSIGSCFQARNSFGDISNIKQKSNSQFIDAGPVSEQCCIGGVSSAGPTSGLHEYLCKCCPLNTCVILPDVLEPVSKFTYRLWPGFHLTQYYAVLVQILPHSSSILLANSQHTILWHLFWVS